MPENSAILKCQGTNRLTISDHKQANYAPINFNFLVDVENAKIQYFGEQDFLATKLIYATNFGGTLKLTATDYEGYLGVTMVLDGRDFTYMASGGNSTLIVTAVCEFFD